jgi:hypothetical protein
MANLQGFDANTVSPDTGFDPVPAGKYKAAVVDSKMKPTKDGRGSYLELVFQILEGEYKDRKVWARLNLENPSKQAVDIARSQLSAICHAVGVMVPQDSVALHNIPLIIDVKVSRNGDNLSNDIRKYISVKDAANLNAEEPGDMSDAPWLQ